jgi:hypothetical protein
MVVVAALPRPRARKGYRHLIGELLWRSPLTLGLPGGKPDMPPHTLAFATS